jgi:DNA (cytosine-5)-methyltransferase 1
MALKNLRAIDFFCGAGGMSFGLQMAGVKVLGGIDIADDCKVTYEENVVGARYLMADVTSISMRKVARTFHIRRNDPALVFAGCSPCQFWSKIRTDKTKSARTAYLLSHFEAFIAHFRPGFVVVENVPGLLTRKRASLLPGLLRFLANIGYNCSDGVINANHYGVPQNRMRYLLIASRLTKNVSLPPARKNPSLVVRSFIGAENGFPEVSAGYRDNSPFNHSTALLSDQNLKRIRLVPRDGGDRRAWSRRKDLQLPAYKHSDKIFRDVYSRMYWDRPAPTITTRFRSVSNGRFGHPDEDRAISIREGATLQTFPKSFRFCAPSLDDCARQIGNAVPPVLAKRIGKHLIRLSDGC